MSGSGDSILDSALIELAKSTRFSPIEFMKAAALMKEQSFSNEKIVEILSGAAGQAEANGYIRLTSYLRQNVNFR